MTRQVALVGKACGVSNFRQREILHGPQGATRCNNPERGNTVAMTGSTAQASHFVEQPRSPWAPFRHPVFTVIWIALVIANVGTWMYNAASGWLMTSLDPDPLTVS